LLVTRSGVNAMALELEHRRREEQQRQLLETTVRQTHDRPAPDQQIARHRCAAAPALADIGHELRTPTTAIRSEDR
jgi:signal transduction histidine kinase